MDSITRKAAAFVAHFNGKTAPAEAREAARIGMLDCIGVMLAGAREPAVGIAEHIVSPNNASNDAPAAVNGRHYNSQDAALINGIAAHVLDFDDVALAGHPSTVLVPAILAEGQSLHASGEDAIEAYLTGYEVWAHLDEAEPGHLHERGFHPTAVLGTLACAAAAARLHRLSEEQTAHALAIAASLASGLVANFGSMTKSLHAGRAAQSGIQAVRLAKAGYTGSVDALEHRSGFLRAISPSGTPDLSVENFRIGEEILAGRYGVNIKQYPTCYATHRAIDAMLGLVKSEGISPENVEKIHVKTGVTQKLMLRNSQPQTGLAAKFSMEFAMASALIAQRVGLAELTDEFVSRPDIQDAMKKVEVTVNEDRADADLPLAPFDLVWVSLKDGSTREHPPVDYAKGSWQRPLDKKELKDKFMSCATQAMSQPRAEELFQSLWALEGIKDLRQISLT